MFRDAVGRDGGGKTILLVDSEGPVNVTGIGDDAVHLMVQSMEAWIVADGRALAEYYGQKFQPSALPKTANLESVSPKNILSALKRATRNTKKGEYHKIRHASELLARLDPQQVKKRCPSCRRLFEALES